MVTIVFETHATTADNENNISSGWNDTRLSQLGVEQAKQLGERHRGQDFDAIFCSDLKRAYQTATIAFSFDPKLIFSDWRLRECNYGDLNGSSKQEVEELKATCIDTPFPQGESYAQCTDRTASFLADLKTMWAGKRVLIIGHRATQYGLEHWINNKPLLESVTAPWTWQPGWEYTLQ